MRVIKMRKRNSTKCINLISRKSLRANKRRNFVLIAAIALTAVMLTALFSTAGSILNSIEESTMYQVGTSAHGGFKFLTREQYDTVAADTEIKDISYNIFIGFAVNNELAENYSEVRYTEPKAAKWGFSYPETGRLPENIREAAMPVQVLDCYGLPHELGQNISVTIRDGNKEYTVSFTVCGLWNNPSATMANEIYVSKAFQEKYAPVWESQTDYREHIAVNSTGGSVNPSLWFHSSVNLDGQMDALKERCGFGNEVNEGVNWAYAASSIDFTSAALVIFLLLIILFSGYLIIYNVFYISVSNDIRFYGLLKTAGATNKQLKKTVHIQALILSAAGIPAGLGLGYLLSVVLLPVIADTFENIPCRIHANPWIFILSGLFAFGTVWISCIKPCRFIKKIPSAEAVKHTDVNQIKRKQKKTGKVTPRSMAWDNILRTRKKTAAVVFSLVLGILLINTTVSIVKGFDEDKYISNYAITDFCVTDRTIRTNTSLDVNLENVTPEDIGYLKNTPGLTDFGLIYMSEGQQYFEGEKLERLKDIFRRNAENFGNEEEKEFYQKKINQEQCIDSHIYGINEFAAGLIESRDGAGDRVADWKLFSTGKYAVVSTYGSNGEDPYYNKGEIILVNLPDGTVKKYEVLATGDLPYALTVQHSHGVDIYILLPETEYLAHCPGCRGAMKAGFNVNPGKTAEAEEYVASYCESGHEELSYQSKKTFAGSFDSLVRTYLITGGALSLVLGLIAVLNFINLTVTSIQNRKKEIGILRAVGMTNRQLRSMLIWEGLYQLILTAAFSLTAGQLITYAIIQLLTKEMWMFTYHFILWPMLAVLPVFAAFACIIPAACCKSIIKKPAYFKEE